MEFPSKHDVCENNRDVSAWNRFYNFESQNENTNYGYIDEKSLRTMLKIDQNVQDQNDEAKVVIETNSVSTKPLENQDSTSFSWDKDLEVIKIEKKMNWLENYNNSNENCNFLKNSTNISDWLKIGPRKITIADETQYCDPDLLQNVLQAKEVFDELDPNEICSARSRANPFETLKSVFFMNRAALKMANIDAVTGFMFTDIDRQIEHKQTKSPYYFADICAGPGGFSEYILWRKRWAFKGFGMTLRGEHDFKLYTSTCASSETFEALYGVLDDGDIYYPDNINEFCNKVKSQTDNLGVHFVMADGGFSVEGQENLQEVLSKRLYVCQCLTALKALRVNGHFVVKMFDLFTPFSVGLLYLMYQCFYKVGIIKPNASRPANSERYFVCSRLKNNEQTRIVTKYLEKAVQTLWDLQAAGSSSNLDVCEIVPADVIHADEIFCNYIKQSNNSLANKQIIGLKKLATFCRFPNLVEPRQEELRMQCLDFWRIPDKPKMSFPYLTTDDLISSQVFTTNFTFPQEVETFKDLEGFFSDPKKQHYLFTGSGKKCNLCNIYAGVGYKRVYRYQRNRWVRVKCVELVRGTVIFAELVKEFLNENDAVLQRSLHVIDALRLGDTSLADLTYVERLDLITIYCQAVNSPSRTDLACIKAKTVMPLVEFGSVRLPTLTDEGQWSALVSDRETHRYITNGMLILKTDSCQSFYSTVSSRLLIHLPSEYEINHLCFWQDIKILIQKKLNLQNK